MSTIYKIYMYVVICVVSERESNSVGEKEKTTESGHWMWETGDYLPMWQAQNQLVKNRFYTLTQKVHISGRSVNTWRFYRQQINNIQQHNHSH